MAQAENAKKLDYTPVTYDDQYILMVNQLKKYFPIKGGLMSQTVGHVKAVDGVTFNLKRGHTMGLVGESGCGKSTTGRTILRLAGEKTGGQVLFNGKEVYDMTGRELRNLRTKMQIIFQDPFSSLSPRLPVGEIIGEAVREHNLVPKNEFNDYIDQVMDDCGLQPYHKTRYPIKKLLSNSIPTMIGSKDRVYGVIEPEIYDTLMDNILKEIKRVTR